MPAMLPLRTTGCKKLKKYSIGVPSKDKKFMPNLQKINELVEKFKRLTPRQTDRQTNEHLQTHTER
jgi:hypothetical protein